MVKIIIQADLPNVTDACDLQRQVEKIEKLIGVENAQIESTRTVTDLPDCLKCEADKPAIDVAQKSASEQGNDTLANGQPRQK